MKPCFEECQECEHWDDVNGCWSGCKTIGDDNCCGRYISNEEGCWEDEEE